MKTIITIATLFVTVTSFAQFQLPNNHQSWDISSTEYLDYHSLIVKNITKKKVILYNAFKGEQTAFFIKIEGVPSDVKPGDMFFLRLDSKYRRHYTMAKNVEFHIKQEEIQSFTENITQNMANYQW